MMTEVTKKYKNLKTIFTIISIGLNVLPILIYAVLGFINGEVHQKLTLGCMVTLALLFVAINVIFKYNIRSTLWVLLIGIHSCINNIVPLLMIMASCTIIDEFIISPKRKKYLNLQTINQEIDKRC